MLWRGGCEVRGNDQTERRVARGELELSVERAGLAILAGFRAGTSADLVCRQRAISEFRALREQPLL